jgi:hypothetical protein
MRYDYETIQSKAGDPDSTGTRYATITAEAGDTIWNPASTKHDIYGPATVEFEFHPAGINAKLVAVG